MKKNRIAAVCILLLLAFALWMCLPARPFDREKCVEYVESHALSRSHNCCAWFVMKGLWAGGCYVPIVRACDYKYVLPRYGFRPVKGEIRQGDIVVFPAVRNHPFGHIAVWTGRQWVSDFKQKAFYVSSAYKDAGYIIYRK